MHEPLQIERCSASHRPRATKKRLPFLQDSFIPNYMPVYPGTRTKSVQPRTWLATVHVSEDRSVAHVVHTNLLCPTCKVNETRKVVIFPKRVRTNQWNNRSGAETRNLAGCANKWISHAWLGWLAA